jgi:hypothetical protein
MIYGVKAYLAVSLVVLTTDNEEFSHVFRSRENILRSSK